MRWKCVLCGSKGNENLGIVLGAPTFFGEALPNKGSQGVMGFFKGGVQLKTTAILASLDRFMSWADLVEFAAEGQSELAKRYTATRILTLGILAASVPKYVQANSTTVSLATTGGDAFLAVFTKVPPIKAQGALRPAFEIWESVRPPQPEPSPEQTLQAPTESAPGGGSLADELRKLAELRAESLITEEEFAIAMNKLMGS